MQLCRRSLYEMHAIEERYYKINRVVLKMLGLWPYQQSYFTQIHKVLYASILLTFILFQVHINLKLCDVILKGIFFKYTY